MCNKTAYERVFLYSKTGSRQQYNPRSWHWPLQKKSVMVVTGDLINNQVVGYLMWDTVISMGQISCLQAVYYCFRHVRKGHRSNTPRFWGETLQSSTEAVRAYISCGCKSITIWKKCNDLRQIICTGKTKRDKSGCDHIWSRQDPVKMSVRKRQMGMGEVPHAAPVFWCKNQNM